MTLVVVTLLCFTLTACEDSRVGVYSLTSASSGGEELDAATLELLGMTATTLTLNDDGTCSLTALGETATGTWDDTGVTLSGESCQASWEGNMLILLNEDQEMRFAKSE